MNALQRLSLIAMRPLAGETLMAISQWAADMTCDHSQRLCKALRLACERAWKALEIALAGESLWTYLDRTTDRCAKNVKFFQM